MTAVKMVVVLLALALLGSQAAPTGPNCDGLNRTVSQDELHKVNGHWVLVYSVSHGVNAEALLTNLTSSHVDITLDQDNTTITYHEKNLHGEVCTTFSTNLTVTSKNDSYEISTNYALLEKNGIVTIDNATEHVQVFESCADSLVLLFIGEGDGHYLLIYRREGHHQNLEQQRTSHSDYDKLVECVNIPQGRKYIYDGTPDSCHKKSAPENKSD
ncbi:saxitoxin and tetrodotoxin-binding protein 1-like [Nelusetta ayraudi]|uniref:saxitoxin and tetrodotoxin-binding protein 1-like n=1 Tax=Nelusetta ayraudi TaxID=303726 RepID=UPI003F6EDCE6